MKDRTGFYAFVSRSGCEGSRRSYSTTYYASTTPLHVASLFFALDRLDNARNKIKLLPYAVLIKI